MTMEELFNHRRIFKRQVIECVQKELDQFGMKVYNANVKELQDMGNSKYFESLARKAHEGAQSQAQFDVANARMIGRVGEAEKKGEAKQRIAKIQRQHSRTRDRAREIEISRVLKIEQIAAQRTAEQRDAELQKDVEQKRAEMELERLRATTVTQAKIAKESAQEKADADLYTQTFTHRPEKQMPSNTTKRPRPKLFTTDTDAANYKRTKDAETMLAAREKEAQAIIHRPQERGRRSYRNAKAIHGLQPKINVWTTGNDQAADQSMAPMQNLFKSLPPLFSTVQDQTGMTPPAWMVNMPRQSQDGDMNVAKRDEWHNPKGINGYK
ncbi:hypothetical protein AC579_6201 [Pseudocercospora musae]|uniref:Band 7 domain-containing protein n=1 Tax=Pseudocercospora musae TaxID=113226 RepID=A0A139I208_9PEZI|nr:hypothetical protein AC579_6201 [Pseudocercospora musae]